MTTTHASTAPTSRLLAGLVHQLELHRTHSPAALDQFGRLASDLFRLLATHPIEDAKRGFVAGDAPGSLDRFAVVRTIETLFKTPVPMPPPPKRDRNRGKARALSGLEAGLVRLCALMHDKMEHWACLAAILEAGARPTHLRGLRPEHFARRDDGWWVHCPATPAFGPVEVRLGAWAEPKLEAMLAWRRQGERMFHRGWQDDPKRVQSAVTMQLRNLLDATGLTCDSQIKPRSICLTGRADRGGRAQRCRLVQATSERSTCPRDAAAVEMRSRGGTA